MVKDSKCKCTCTQNAEGKLLLANARIHQLEGQVAALSEELALNRLQHGITRTNCSIQIERNMHLNRIVDEYEHKLSLCEKLLRRFGIVVT